MVRLAAPGAATLLVSKLQVDPASEEDRVHVSATVPVNPSFGVTESAMVAEPPVGSVWLRDAGSTRKCGFGVPFSALISAVASTEPNPVTWS